MNNKVLILIIALIFVFGVGIFLLSNKSDKQKTPREAPVQLNPTTQAQKLPTQVNIQEVKVTVTANGFSPQTITIKTGTRVLWINKSEKLINISSAVHPTHLVYPALNLGDFPNDSSVQLVFDKQGTYKYHNHLNPNQSGTVIVE